MQLFEHDISPEKDKIALVSSRLADDFSGAESSELIDAASLLFEHPEARNELMDAARLSFYLDLLVCDFDHSANEELFSPVLTVFNEGDNPVRIFRDDSGAPLLIPPKEEIVIRNLPLVRSSKVASSLPFVFRLASGIRVRPALSRFRPFDLFVFFFSFAFLALILYRIN